MAEAALEGWTRFAAMLADESRAMLVDAARLVVSLKPDRSFVTDLDQRIERRLRALIAERFPSHGILGEEEEDRLPDAELVWVLDPIDATAPFIAGAPVYGTRIALLRDDVPILGVINLPATGDRWIGAAGQPTRHNAGPCATHSCARLDAAILSASNPDFFAASERPALRVLRLAIAWRIYGGCMAYGLLASGRTDLAIDTMLLSRPAQIALLEAAFRRPSRSDIDVSRHVGLPRSHRCGSSRWTRTRRPRSAVSSSPAGNPFSPRCAAETSWRRMSW
jgi:fructose-1,6-bisphosphatase/inositol monophosphatase family enzyme